METRLFFLSIAVVAIGLFALPATISMFAGQHSWYDPKDQGIPCEKCHWIEYEEMRSGTYGVHSPHRTADKLFECTECHNVSMNVSHYFKTGQVGGHTPVHAATTVSCLACHQELYSSGTYCAASCHFDIDGRNAMHTLARKYDWDHDQCIKCHRYLSEKSGDEAFVNDMATNVFISHVDEELSHPQEGHRAFFLAMKNEETQLSDSNEACLGCHSRVGVNISWTRNQYVSYHVTCDKSGYNVTWNTSDDLGTNQTLFNSSSGWDW
ncbi:MAG TPA: hypothetical protein EYP67_05595 [Methanosarcinales archaeon]|nr:hypothetical protein [Methanosarcinales archaeon]